MAPHQDPRHRRPRRQPGSVRVKYPPCPPWTPVFRTLSSLQSTIDAAWERRSELTPGSAGAEVRDAVATAIAELDCGRLRVAEKADGRWVTHQWLKKAVLLSFRLADNVALGGAADAPLRFYDKVPTKFARFDEAAFAASGVRVVPPAVARRGAYIAPNVVLMPSYVNIGAYVDEGTMVDTWATVGSCAQIGKRVHLSGGVGIGGVLEPLQANPTIIEDNCFIGARSEVVEGVDRRGEFGSGHGRVHRPEHQDLRPFKTGRVSYGRVPAGSVVVAGQPPLGRGQLSAVLRGDRQAGRRRHARQDEHQRAAAKLGMSVSLKSAEDITRMRVAGALAAEVLDYITPHVAAGVTTAELDGLCHDYMVDVQDTIPAPLNYAPPGYQPYPASICTSVNHVVCHGIPGDKKLKSGDIVNIDVTVIKDGFHGDTSRMFYVGDARHPGASACAR